MFWCKKGGVLYPFGACMRGEKGCRNIPYPFNVLLFARMGPITIFLFFFFFYLPFCPDHLRDMMRNISGGCLFWEMSKGSFGDQKSLLAYQL